MGESNDPRESSREGGRDEGRAAPRGRGGRGKGRHSHTHARAHRGRKRGGGGKDSRAQRAPADAEAPQTQVRGAVGETGACEARKDRVTRGKRAEKEASPLAHVRLDHARSAHASRTFARHHSEQAESTYKGCSVCVGGCREGERASFGRVALTRLPSASFLRVQHASAAPAQDSGSPRKAWQDGSRGGEGECAPQKAAGAGEGGVFARVGGRGRRRGAQGGAGGSRGRAGEPEARGEARKERHKPRGGVRKPAQWRHGSGRRRAEAAARRAALTWHRAGAEPRAPPQAQAQAVGGSAHADASEPLERPEAPMHEAAYLTARPNSPAVAWFERFAAQPARSGVGVAGGAGGVSPRMHQEQFDDYDDDYAFWSHGPGAGGGAFAVGEDDVSVDGAAGAEEDCGSEGGSVDGGAATESGEENEGGAQLESQLGDALGEAWAYIEALEKENAALREKVEALERQAPSKGGDDLTGADKGATDPDKGDKHAEGGSVGAGGSGGT